MTKIRQIYQLYLKKCLLYNLIFISILFFAHCFWGNMMYLVYPLLALVIVLDNLENGFSYIIFSIPFIFLNVNISEILFLVCCFAYIIKFYIIFFFKEKNKPNLYSLITLLAFFVYCILPTGEYNLNTLIRLFIFIAIFVALGMVTQKPETFRGQFNIKLICYSIMLSSIFSLTYHFSPYLQDYLIILSINGNMTRFMALFIQPNVLAMFCEVLLSFLTFFILTKNFNREDIFLFVVIAFIGLLTFSKTYIIILTLILAILAVYFLTQNFKKTASIIIPLLVLLMLTCLAFPKFVHSFSDRFIGSVSDCNSFKDFMNMLTTDRYDLWIEYSKYIFTHPLVLFFGRGLGAPVIGLQSPHNGYIAIIYELGIVGTCLFALSLYFIFRNYFLKTHKKPHWAIFVPILVLAMIFIAEDLIFFIFE